MKISQEEYFKDIEILISKLDKKFDCIVASKRSGWIMGVFFSNKLEIPVFTVSEIESIPLKFNNILVVDDKIDKGKTIKRIKNQLENKNITTACMYVENNIFPDYYIRRLSMNHKMFYEF
jgi:hypoxanthine phosphoribosyltransferase